MVRMLAKSDTLLMQCGLIIEPGDEVEVYGCRCRVEEAVPVFGAWGSFINLALRLDGDGAERLREILTFRLEAEEGATQGGRTVS